MKKTNRKLQADLEEAECVHAYDAAIASKEKAIPFEEAIAEIRALRVRIPTQRKMRGRKNAKEDPATI